MPYGHASMLLLGEGSEATEIYNKYDKIRPHSIRSLQFDQNVRPLSFRPEIIDIFKATRLRGIKPTEIDLRIAKLRKQACYKRVGWLCCKHRITLKTLQSSLAFLLCQFYLFRLLCSGIKDRKSVVLPHPEGYLNSSSSSCSSS